MAVQQRQGRDRVQALPAALVGTGLVISSPSRAGSVPGLAALRSSRQPSRETGAMTTPSESPFLICLAAGAIASGDPVAMPALTQLRFVSDAEAVPLLVLGTEQKPFLVRSLSCSGLGYKRTEQGWDVLSRLLVSDQDSNVRAEAANLASYGVERAWPFLQQAFAADDAWLVRCSILLSWPNSRRLISTGCWSWPAWPSPIPTARCG